MNHTESGHLLALIQSYDRRTVGEADIFSWQAALHDVEFADGRDAVIGYYREAREWIMPADVRTRALEMANRRAGRRRIAELDLPAVEDGPTAPLTPDEWERFAQQARAHGVEPSIGRRVSGG